MPIFCEYQKPCLLYDHIPKSNFDGDLKLFSVYMELLCEY